MSWTGAIPTFDVGQQLTASQMNKVANNVNFLGNVPAGRLYITDTTIIETATTQVLHTTTTFLSGGMTFGSNGLTVPVAGIYEVDASIAYQAADHEPAVGNYWTHVYVNGAEVRRWQVYYSAAAAACPQPGGSDLIKLASGATVTLYGHNEDGKSSATTYEFPTTWLSLALKIPIVT